MAATFTVRRALQPRDSITPVSLRADFALANETGGDVDYIRNSPNISLYAFDLPAREAVFVEVPDQAGLLDDSLPFLYQRQRALARRVHVVSFDELRRMAADLPARKDGMLLVYSTGRCGSTLLGGILRRASKTAVLSEPDMFTQLRSHDLPEHERQALARQAMSLLLERFGGNGVRVVIKLRSQACRLWSSFDAALSNPPSLFMYRNAIDVVHSFDRLNDSMNGLSAWLRKVPVLSTLAEALRQRRLLGTVQVMREDFGSTLIGCSPTDVVSMCGWRGFLLLRWLRYVEEYSRARGRSPESVAALRYEDLIRDTRGTVGALFGRFGWSPDEVEHCCGATQRHSQENTRLAASRTSGRLDRQSSDLMREIMRRYTSLGDAHAVLPGTIQTSADVPSTGGSLDSRAGRPTPSRPG
jgi:hypothetical protein